MKNKILVKYRAFAFTVLVSLISVSIFYSCGANLFSLKDDVKLGEDLDKEIKSMPAEYPMLQGYPEVAQYVNNMGKYIVNKSPEIKYKNEFPYNFQVIDDSIVNAFCTPGGYIYVYTGLMRFIDNEATLAGVIAHEIAHAECRHTTQRLTSYYGVSVLMSIVLGNNPGTVEQILANLFTGIGFLAYSRADETESDDYSIKYLSSTKYFPGAIRFFFDKIIKEQAARGSTPGDLDRLLSTHPLPQDRVDNVYEQLRANKIPIDTSRNLFTAEYQYFKTKLPPRR